MSAWLIRRSQPCDQDLIEATVVRSLHAYADRSRARLLAKSMAPHCIVACTYDDPTVALGFICATGETLHMAFTKAAFRRMGIYRSLIGNQRIKYFSLHISGSGPFLKSQKLRYNPLSLMVAK